MKIEFLPTSELRTSPNNARTHSQKQIRKIAQSISKLGFNTPVLIDDKQQIIAGHGRVEAAKLLGLEVVPTCLLSHLSEAQTRAYIIADNRLAELAGWDKEILAIELQALIDLDVEVELTGFDAAQVDILLEDAREAKSETGSEDLVPELSSDSAVTRAGDLWVLGKHLLLNGDARKHASYQCLLDGAKAEFVFTDPPYNLAIEGHVSGLGQHHHREFAMASGEMNEAEFTEFLNSTFDRLVENSADGSVHQIFMDWRHLLEMMTAGRKAYAELKNLAVWRKTNAGMGSFYRSQHELVFIWKSGTAPHINNFELGQHGRHRSNLWDYPGVNTWRMGRSEEMSMHPTVKPVALVADAIKDCSRRNGLVLDPFCGSGTILIAAERTGRRARAIEIDPLYVDVAIQRWQNYTGKFAVLAESGERFEQVGEMRRANRVSSDQNATSE